MLEKSDIELLSQMMGEKIGTANSALETKLSQMMDDKISASENRMLAYFEGKIEPQLQLLAEGHQQLLETLAPVSRVEALETDMSVLKYTVAQLAAEVKELKAAM